MCLTQHNPGDAGLRTAGSAQRVLGTGGTPHLHPNQLDSHSAATALWPLCPLCHSEIPPELCIVLLLCTLICAASYWAEGHSSNHDRFTLIFVIKCDTMLDQKTFQNPYMWQCPTPAVTQSIKVMTGAFIPATFSSTQPRAAERNKGSLPPTPASPEPL